LQTIHYVTPLYELCSILSYDVENLTPFIKLLPSVGSSMCLPYQPQNMADEDTGRWYNRLYKSVYNKTRHEI